MAALSTHCPNLNDLTDPRLAAKDRAKRPNQMTADLFSEENRGLVNDTSAAEVSYEMRRDGVDATEAHTSWGGLWSVGLDWCRVPIDMFSLRTLVFFCISGFSQTIYIMFCCVCVV
ncbi:uncharacterized protein LOC111463801 isoform X4 [Cucurbita moschata]|uniref:Uncharacterized protein LOC111463801 isoform X4 n=1 Tax=Cucurbita moschata TaxID=3662 RepID=A0A6J1HG88_CUCMO|nr:uncharacterized protein LOC111463801 isoform X4 [Cucurbita moschata]